MTCTVYWDVVSCCSLQGHRRFGGLYGLHIHDQQISQISNSKKKILRIIHPRTQYSYTALIKKNEIFYMLLEKIQEVQRETINFASSSFSLFLPFLCPFVSLSLFILSWLKQRINLHLHSSDGRVSNTGLPPP
jgi:hypothetical protein